MYSANNFAEDYTYLSAERYMSPTNGENNTSSGGGNGDSSDADLHDVSLSLDAVLSLLADQDRRDLIQYLRESSEQTCSIDDCVGYLMKQEEERTAERPSHDRVAMVIHHIHIPKLADTGVVEYDARSREIRYRSDDRLESWLDRIQRAESASE